MRKLIESILLLTIISSGLMGQDTIWQAEAETGIISGTAEIVSGCSYASQGNFVRLNSAQGNSLRMDDIQISDSGSYRLLIHYFYLGEQPFELIANDSSVGVYKLPAATWCFQGPPKEYAIEIPLKEGSNSLEFKTWNNKNAPFFDRFFLTEIFKPEVYINSRENRILKGTDSEIILSLNGVSTLEETIVLDVAGNNDYSLPDTLIKIPAGERNLSLPLTYYHNESFEDSSVIVFVKSVSQGLNISEKDSITIKVVEEAQTFYINDESGNDRNSGLDPGLSWNSLEKVNSFSFVQGDSVLFHSGDIFKSQLVISCSGTPGAPVYYGKYGGEINPVIDAANAPGGAYTSSILIHNASHISIENIDITNDRRISRPGQDDIQGFGIYILNDGIGPLQNLQFKRLNIAEVYPISIEGVEFNSVKVAGIYLHSTINSLVGKEKHIRDVVIEDCFITHTGKYGIWARHEGAWNDIGNDTLNRNMNIVIKNNHFYETGGAGVTLSRCYNALLEGNIIEHHGSDYDPRMVNRASGAWFWKSINIMAQYNKVIHGRGPLDSYGIHVDWGNRNVFIQYNYSEDIEGGFVEILGDNINSVYRYNISVNDGFRDYLGNSIWISRYAGSGDDGVNYISSDSSYIYNNTIYIDGSVKPGIQIRGKNTFIYNNIFYSLENSAFAAVLDILAYDGASIKISNNLYFGNVNSLFTNYDFNPFFGDPLFSDPGANEIDAYKLLKGSIAIDSGYSFKEPVFSMAGKGIFKDITPTARADIFGNSVNIQESLPNIGAFNGKYPDTTVVRRLLHYNSWLVHAYPNPANKLINLEINSQSRQQLLIQWMEPDGKILLTELYDLGPGNNYLQLKLPQHSASSVKFLTLTINEGRKTIRVIQNTE